MIAGYINSKFKAIYKDVIQEAKRIHDSSDCLEDEKNVKVLTDFAMRLIKLHDILGKNIEISPIVETEKKEVKEPEVIQESKEPEDINTANEIMSDLKRSNVYRLIPTQINPVWENAKIDIKIGYNFNYRGMALQVVTDSGWVSKDYNCKIFVIDPVIGLPITSYEGTISELEDRLSNVFINYLKTIESNKESIVQLANAFKKLKEVAQKAA